MKYIKYTLTTALVSLFISGVAHAGTVQLYNGMSGNIPQLVVVTGLNALNNGDVKTFNNVKSGSSSFFSAKSKICYKRSSNINDSNSPLQANWTCKSETTSSGTTKMYVN